MTNTFLINDDKAAFGPLTNLINPEWMKERMRERMINEMNADPQTDELLKENVDKYVDMCKQFDDGIKSITDERGADYGHPLDNFDNMARATPVLAQCKDPVVREALRMCWFKICRLVVAPDHGDSVLDLAGYARTIAMIHDERRRRADHDS